MRTRRRPPRDAAVFPSAPTFIISPNGILRRKTIAAKRGSGKLRIRRNLFIVPLCGGRDGSSRSDAKRIFKAYGDARSSALFRCIEDINFSASADACVSRVRKSRLKHVGCGRNASPGALAVLKNFGRAADGGAGLKRDKQQARSDADHAFRSGPQSGMQHPGR